MLISPMGADLADLLEKGIINTLKSQKFEDVFSFPKVGYVTVVV